MKASFQERSEGSPGTNIVDGSCVKGIPHFDHYFAWQVSDVLVRGILQFCCHRCPCVTFTSSTVLPWTGRFWNRPVSIAFAIMFCQKVLLTVLPTSQKWTSEHSWVDSFQWQWSTFSCRAFCRSHCYSSRTKRVNTFPPLSGLTQQIYFYKKYKLWKIVFLKIKCKNVKVNSVIIKKNH